MTLYCTALIVLHAQRCSSLTLFNTGTYNSLYRHQNKFIQTKNIVTRIIHCNSLTEKAFLRFWRQTRADGHPLGSAVCWTAFSSLPQGCPAAWRHPRTWQIQNPSPWQLNRRNGGNNYQSVAYRSPTMRKYCEDTAASRNIHRKCHKREYCCT